MPRDQDFIWIDRGARVLPFAGLVSALVQMFREKRDPLKELQALLDKNKANAPASDSRIAGRSPRIAVLDEHALFIPQLHASAPRLDGEARVFFRDGERPGVLEILSFDAAGACTVHRVSGLALANLAAKATEQLRRGMSA